MKNMQKTIDKWYRASKYKDASCAQEAVAEALHNDGSLSIVDDDGHTIKIYEDGDSVVIMKTGPDGYLLRV